MNALNWQKTAGVIVLTTAILMSLAAFWVPINLVPYESYRAANLFFEIQPRALLGTVAKVFRLGPLNFNYLILSCLSFWIFLVLYQIYQSLFGQKINDKKDFVIFFALSFIFAFSTVTVLTYSPAGFVDVVPYALIALVIVLGKRIAEPTDWAILFGATLLLVMAVMVHEKTLFDIAILFTWFLWKFGLRRALIYIAPGVLISLLFLMSVSTKESAGLPPGAYVTILMSGFAFLTQWSLNFWGIVAGGGALWFLYFIFSRQFVNAGESKPQVMMRLLIVALMLLICLCTLLVAADTNRMVGLIWLPTVLLMQEIKLATIFRSAKSRIGLGCLCAFQLAIPPVLIYNNGVLPFSCYSVSLVGHLPKEVDIVPATMGPFGLYALSRSNPSRPWRKRCSDVAGT